MHYQMTHASRINFLLLSKKRGNSYVNYIYKRKQDNVYLLVSLSQFQMFTFLPSCLYKIYIIKNMCREEICVIVWNHNIIIKLTSYIFRLNPFLI